MMPIKKKKPSGTPSVPDQPAAADDPETMLVARADPSEALEPAIESDMEPVGAEATVPTKKRRADSESPQALRPTRRATLMYQRFEAMGFARKLTTLAERVVLEDWARAWGYRVAPSKMDALLKKVREEIRADAAEEEAFRRRCISQYAMLKRWAQWHHWRDRLAEHDAEVQEQIERETLQQRIDMNKRQAVYAGALHQESFEYTRELIKQGKLGGRDAVQAFLGSAQQERVALGASTSIQEQRGRLAVGVNQSGEVTVHQDITGTAALDVDVSGTLTVQHEHSGSVQINVTQLNVDLLRLLEHQASLGNGAWRAAVGLPAPTTTPMRAPQATVAEGRVVESESSAGSGTESPIATAAEPDARTPGYHRLAAWIAPAPSPTTALPQAPDAVTSVESASTQTLELAE